MAGPPQPGARSPHPERAGGRRPGRDRPRHYWYDVGIMDPVGQLLNQITDTLPEDRRTLRRLKTRIAAQGKSPLIRNDALLDRYRREVAHGLRRADERVERILTLNAIRSQSGIATITVITEPYACPGRCVYCPTEARAPKSYLTNEPAVRLLVLDFDGFGHSGIIIGGRRNPCNGFAFCLR